MNSSDAKNNLLLFNQNNCEKINGLFIEIVYLTHLEKFKEY